jgi:hypothetical protein
MTRRFVLALTAVALLAASVLAQPAAQARTAAQAGIAGREAGWPRQVYAPYFETWTSDRSPSRRQVRRAVLQPRLPPDG